MSKAGKLNLRGQWSEIFQLYPTLVSLFPLYLTCRLSKSVASAFFTPSGQDSGPALWGAVPTVHRWLR